MTILTEEQEEQWSADQLANYTEIGLLDDIAQYKHEFVPRSRLQCLRCGTREVDMTHWRKMGLGLCLGCSVHVRATATQSGRLAAEELIAGMVPQRYRRFEFGGFVRYSDELKSTYSRVLDWSRRVSSNETVGSLYLWSGPGDHGTGNGNGKSSLLYSSFKFAARRRVTAHRTVVGYDDLGWENTNLRTFAYDFNTAVIEPFHRALRRDGTKMISMTPFLPVAGSMVKPIETVDDLVGGIIGKTSVLYLDDVGARVSGRMAAQLYELLFDTRAAESLPTFVTSNYSPDALGGIIGTRAVSRLLRTNCEVIEVRAPDFSTVRHLIRPMGCAAEGVTP